MHQILRYRSNLSKRHQHGKSQKRPDELRAHPTSFVISYSVQAWHGKSCDHPNDRKVSATGRGKVPHRDIIEKFNQHHVSSGLLRCQHRRYPIPSPLPLSLYHFKYSIYATKTIAPGIVDASRYVILSLREPAFVLGVGETAGVVVVAAGGGDVALPLGLDVVVLKGVETVRNVPFWLQP